MSTPPTRTDVVVVGAGLSGLVAARNLVRQGIEVVVLESADRVGGRSYAVTSELGSRLDLGGQWIGCHHQRLQTLGDELGLTRFRMHTSQVAPMLEGERRVSLLHSATLVVGIALGCVAVLSRVGVPARMNSTTLAAWLRRVPGRRARRLLELAAGISSAADLDQLSLLAMTRMIRLQGGVVQLLSTRGGAQDSLFVEGAGSIAERLAAELAGRVHLQQRVTSIERDGSGVILRTPTAEVRAVKVIIATQPPATAKIHYRPELPPKRATLERETYKGTVYKAVAVYPGPFWRTGIGAELVQLASPGFACFDSSPPDGAAATTGRTPRGGDPFPRQLA